jgi:putative transposase
MAGPTTVHRTYRYRLYPTRGQALALETQLGFACDLYNAALEQRRYGWRAGQRIGYFRQCRDVTDLRAAGDGPAQISCSAMRDPLRRLDRAFQAFFRRLKAGEKPGYPRFRARRRYDSLTWYEAWSIRERRLALPGIGHLKVKWHRELPAWVRTYRDGPRRRRPLVRLFCSGAPRADSAESCRHAGRGRGPGDHELCGPLDR